MIWPDPRDYSVSKGKIAVLKPEFEMSGAATSLGRMICSKPKNSSGDHHRLNDTDSWLGVGCGEPLVFGVSGRFHLFNRLAVIDEFGLANSGQLEMTCL